MKEKGKVVSIEEGDAVVALDSREACSKCCACDPTKRGSNITVRSPQAEGLSVGDTVEVEITCTSMMKIYTILYGVPLLVFVGIMLVIYGLSKSPVASFAGAIISTILTYLLIGYYIKRTSGIMPDINVSKTLE